MSNRIGMTILETGRLSEALDLGCDLYLIMHSDAGPGIVDAIRERRPNARILVRRWGGIADSPESVARQIAEWFPVYRQRGVTDVIPFNEADRIEEGGHTPGYVAEFFRQLAPLVRAGCPGIRLHWPAPAHEAFYAAIGQWRDAAALAEAIDGHWYVDADGIDRLGTFFESHFPGKLWYVTEYSSVGLNAPPPARGVEEDAYQACRKAHNWPHCGGVVFFTFTWPGAEPGGQAEEIANDPLTQAGIRRALADLSRPVPEPPAPTPEPEPAPEKPMITTAMYLWQFGGGGRIYREKSYREFAQTARAYGIQQIWFKAFEAGSFATWDPSPLGLGSLDRIKRCSQECAEEGVQAVFWGVPDGGTWRQDADLAQRIAAVAGNVIHIDLENFAEFWNAPRHGTTGQPPFFQSLKDAGLAVDVSAVGRFGEPELTPWEEIVDNVDSVYLQSYWTDFSQPAVRVVTDDINAMLAVGIPIEKLGSIFPHNGTRADMDAAFEAARTLGVTRFAVWTWDWVQGVWPFEFLRDVAGAAPAPPLDKDALWRDLVGVGSEAKAASETLIWVSTPGNTEVTEAAALGEAERIAGLLTDAAGQILDLTGRLKAGT